MSLGEESVLGKVGDDFQRCHPSGVLYRQYADLLHEIGDLRVYVKGQKMPLHGIDYHLEEVPPFGEHLSYNRFILTFFFHTIEEVLAFIRRFPIRRSNPQDDQGSGLLASGKLVAFPTKNGVWLGSPDATNVEAVKRIFIAKDALPSILIVHRHLNNSRSGT